MRHHRTHFVDNSDGTVDCHDTPEITVRSLAEVGGVREGRKYTRRLNRKARALGFNTFSAFVQHIASLKAFGKTEAVLALQRAFK